MDSLDKVMSGGIRDIEAAFVVEGAVIEVPVVGGGAGKGNGGCLHGGKGVDDELVGRGGFGDFGGQGSIEHVNVKGGEQDSLGVVSGGVNLILSGKSIGGTHGSAWGVVPFKIIVLEEHLPSSLPAG